MDLVKGKKCLWDLGHFWRLKKSWNDNGKARLIFLAMSGVSKVWNLLEKGEKTDENGLD